MVCIHLILLLRSVLGCRRSHEAALFVFVVVFAEAARGGRVEAVEYLITEHNVDVNERTNKGKGGTPLWWAEKSLRPDHDVIALLKRHGAVAIAPQKKGD